MTGGIEAFAILHFRKATLSLLNVNRPEMNVLTVLKTIKGNDELKAVRIASYSTETHPETFKEATRLDASEFLLKGSVGFDRLVNRICELANEPHARH